MFVPQPSERATQAPGITPAVVAPLGRDLKRYAAAGHRDDRVEVRGDRSPGRVARAKDQRRAPESSLAKLRARSWTREPRGQG